MKKKILFVITKGNFGGAQRYVYDLATNLPNNSFEAIVACGNKEGTILIEKLKEKNIKTITLENSEREINLKNDFGTFRELIKITKEEKPDVVHFNSSKIGFLGAMAILVLKFYSIIHNTCPIPHSVFTSHGWAFNEKNRSLLARIVFYIAHYFTVLVCDKTIAVSIKTGRDISWLPFIQNKIKVIYNGIAPFAKMTKKAASEILRKEKGEITIYSMSELHPNKGLDVALRGIALLGDSYKNKVQYYVAGSGEEKENLEKLTKNLNIENQTHFLGFVEDAKRLLSGADMLLFPSRTENLPYAILEAGLAGLPIVSTSVGGCPEVIRDMKNGILVHKNNPKEIAEAVMYILDHPNKAKEFKIEIQKTVTNFFSLDRMLSETISLYSKLLAPSL